MAIIRCRAVCARHRLQISKTLLYQDLYGTHQCHLELEHNDLDNLHFYIATSEARSYLTVRIVEDLCTVKF
jgi:hypothetical protein